jgi:uncharacterized repeat protein (TIGR01451 family)
MSFRIALLSFLAGSLIVAGVSTAGAAVQHPRVRGTIAAPVADLLVTKSAPVSAAAGANITYDVTVFNNGPDGATNIILTDPLPEGLTFISETQNSGPAFSCVTPAVGTGGTITCTIAALALDVTADFTIVANIPAAAPPGTTFTNIATVSSDTDPNEENDSSAAATTVPQPEADLSVSKLGPDSAAVDADVVYSITLNNSGPSDAQSVTLNDPLPAPMTFVSLNQTSGPAFSCSTPVVGASGTVTCTIGVFITGASATFTLTGHIPPGTAPGTVFNNSATATSPTFDPDTDNNTGLTGLTVTNVDLAITKSGPATATAGQPISWTITASSPGTGTAQNVTITDSLPPGTTFLSLVQSSGPAATCSTPPVGSNGTITCSLATFAPAASVTFTLNAVVNVSVPAGSVLSNTASIGNTNGDANAANNTSTSSASVIAFADLVLTKSGPPAVTAGMTATYTITLTNNGPSDAAIVSLTDLVPANTTFASITQTGTPLFTCSTPAAGGTGTVSCSSGVFPVAATVTFTLTLNVSPAAANGSSLTNTATATSAATDPTPGNNSASSTATVVTSADLSITKTAPAATTTGSNLTYLINITNSGPSDGAGVVLTDVIPPNTTFVSESQTGGPAFTCTNPAAGAAGTVSCTLGSLPNGASASFNLVVNVQTSAPAGPLSNTATVSAATTDPNPANNSATATTTVAVAVADVSISKTAGAGPFGTGRPVTYTIAVANAGPTAATNVVVSDVLPAGTTFTSATPTQGSCSGTTTVTCTLGTLAGGGSATISLVVTLPAAAGPVSNTATVTATEADPNPANNTSTATINAIPAANIPTLSPFVLLLLAMALAMAGVTARQ